VLSYRQHRIAGLDDNYTSATITNNRGNTLSVPATQATTFTVDK
jgi:hypothetical protein